MVRVGLRPVARVSGCRSRTEVQFHMSDTPAFDLLMQATTQLEALAAPLVERLEGAEAERGRERLAAVTELVVRANAAQAESLLAEARARVLAEQSRPAVCADEAFARVLAECNAKEGV